MNRLLTFVMLLVIAAASFFLWKGNPPSQAGQAGTPAIGGQFTLTDTQGKPFTSAQLLGKTSLIFFGYTRCPDICPTTLATLRDTLAALGDKANNLRVVFITVDPEHDTPPVLAEYLKQFDPRIIGLTGSIPQIKQVADAYKVYYSEPEAHHHDMGDMHMDEPAPPINHSGLLYLMGKDGNYLTHFSYDVAPQELTKALKDVL